MNICNDLTAIVPMMVFAFIVILAALIIVLFQKGGDNHRSNRRLE